MHVNTRPVSGLVADTKGMLYGTAIGGGASNYGLVFKFDPLSGAITTLYTFSGSYAGPSSNVAFSRAGILYGSVRSLKNTSIVYSIDPVSGAFNVVYNLDTTEMRIDDAPLIDGDGIIYDTTYDDGSARDAGTVFRLDPATGIATTLFQFGGGKHGGPPGGLVFGKKGLLYGATSDGGSTYVYKTQPGYGTIFSLKP